jgi:hypothetical protein
MVDVLNSLIDAEKKSQEVIPGIVSAGDGLSISIYFAILSAFPVAWQSEQNFG